MIALFYIGVILVSAGVVSMITSIVNEFLCVHYRYSDFGTN